MRRKDAVQAYVSLPADLHKRLKQFKEQRMPTMNRAIVYLLYKALRAEETVINAE